MSDDIQIDSTTTSDANNLTVLQSQIQTLTELYNRVTTLRNIPPLLLRSPAQQTLLSIPQNDVRAQFSQLHQIADTIRSASVQQALKRAKTSFDSDPTELTTNPRRENRKRRFALPLHSTASQLTAYATSRPPTPDSPQPYVNLEPARPPLFPPLDATTPPLSLFDLHHYILHFNQTHNSKIHIWYHTPPPSTSSIKPRILRFIIPDVLTCYVAFDTKSDSDTTLVVETVSLFGPREKKAPHSQSNFAVFRQLSQQISKVLHSEPSAPLQSVVDLLNSYSTLFIDPCHICMRVLTAEGHVPPVVRAWSEGDGDKWESRHVNCR